VLRAWRREFPNTLSAIENRSGQITDVKQTTRNAFDYALLEGRVEALEKQMEKTYH
jgi:hypothetical protein